jgi:hypothetical protein
MALKHAPLCFKTVNGGAITCIMFGSVTRVFYFAIDPHRYIDSCGAPRFCFYEFWAEAYVAFFFSIHHTFDGKTESVLYVLCIPYLLSAFVVRFFVFTRLRFMLRTLPVADGHRGLESSRHDI